MQEPEEEDLTEETEIEAEEAAAEEVREEIFAAFETEAFFEILREFVSDNHIEVSLPAGIYRYQVIARGFLSGQG